MGVFCGFILCPSQCCGLSHTWVRYPGFSGHGVKCPILTTVVPGFSGDLIGYTIRSKWGSLGDLYLARKNRLCVLFLALCVVSGWNKVFPKENSSCEVFMVTNCPYAGINKWMEKSNNFLNNGTCGNTMVKPQTVRYRLRKYIHRKFGNIPEFEKCHSIQS